MTDKQLFIIIKQNIPVNQYTFDLSYYHEQERKGYNVDYMRAESGELENYQNGFLLIDYDSFVYDDLVEENNVTVISKPYQKLALVVSSLCRGNYTKDKIDVALKELTDLIAKNVEGFNGFAFPQIRSQEIRYTGYFIDLSEDADEDKLYITGKNHLNNHFYKVLIDHNIDVFDFIFSDRYVLVTDTLPTHEFLKMIYDGEVDLDNNKVIAILDWKGTTEEF